MNLYTGFPLPIEAKFKISSLFYNKIFIRIQNPELVLFSFIAKKISKIRLHSNSHNSGNYMEYNAHILHATIAYVHIQLVQA